MEEFKWKIDFWTIFFSVVSIILFILALFVPEQRNLILTFLVISILFAIIIFYINRINHNEKLIHNLRLGQIQLTKELKENFNYLKELYSLKLEIEMIKKSIKKAQITLLDIVKIVVAIILIYVIVEVVKSLFG